MSFELIDGGGVSRLRDIIRKVGADTGISCEIGTVLSPPPALSVQIDGMKIPLEADDLIVAQHLTRWTEKIAVRGLPTTKLTMNQYTRRSKVTVSSSTDTSEMYEDEFDFTAGSIEVNEIEIEHLDELKAGERVIIVMASEGQRFYVIDRIGA